jgi:hypothetical protein
MADFELRDKARKITNSRNLAALANDTKWKELFSVIQSQSISLEFKFIDTEEATKSTRSWVPTGCYIESMEFGPELFVFIEWVRSKNSALVEIAKNVGLAFEVENGNVTVYGYK